MTVTLHNVKMQYLRPQFVREMINNKIVPFYLLPILVFS